MGREAPHYLAQPVPLYADTRQTNSLNDQEVLELARSAAQQTIDQDGDLAQHPQLQQELNYRYQKLMGGAILT